MVQEDQSSTTIALKTVDRGIQAAPGDVDLLFRRGILFEKTNRKDDALAAMRRVLDLDPQNANALNYIGYTYAEMGISSPGSAADGQDRPSKLQPEDATL